ncbi:MAG: type 1 glutamine amidotransferase [Actinomycetota bacterium]
MSSSSPRAVVVAHDPMETAGMVGRRLVDHGFELVELVVTEAADKPRSDVPFVDPADHDLVVVMGSVHSVYDTETIGSWIGRELDFLRAADAAGVPVLGICFGGQALAAAHGGAVIRSERKQVGWYPVPSDRPELSVGPWMQWHYDRFEAPPAAEVLSVDDYGVQAFTLRRNLGVQFHPEVDPDHLQRWFDGGGVEELASLGLDPDPIMADARRHASQERTNTLVDWFLADIADFQPAAV